jgi:hypothetical protein
VPKPQQVSEMKDDPCWKGYEMIGKKKKNGKKVPNCVPVDEAFERMVSENTPSDREWGKSSLTKIYSDATPGQSFPADTLFEKIRAKKGKKKLAKEDNIPAMGYEFGNAGIGDTFGVVRSPTGLGYGYSLPMSESVIAWSNKEETIDRFVAKYGQDAERKLYEAAQKLSQIDVGNIGPKYFTGLRESWDAVGGRDMGTVSKQGSKEDVIEEEDDKPVDLSQKRDEKKLKDFHKGLMDDLGSRVDQYAEIVQNHIDSGKFTMRVGDRFSTQHSRDRNKPPSKITGYYVNSKNPDGDYGYHIETPTEDGLEQTIMSLRHPGSEKRFGPEKWAEIQAGVRKYEPLKSIKEESQQRSPQEIQAQQDSINQERQRFNSAKKPNLSPKKSPETLRSVINKYQNTEPGYSGPAGEFLTNMGKPDESGSQASRFMGKVFSGIQSASDSANAGLRSAGNYVRGAASSAVDKATEIGAGVQAARVRRNTQQTSTPTAPTAPTKNQDANPIRTGLRSAFGISEPTDQKDIDADAKQAANVNKLKNNVLAVPTSAIGSAIGDAASSAVSAIGDAASSASSSVRDSFKAAADRRRGQNAEYQRQRQSDNPSAGLDEESWQDAKHKNPKGGLKQSGVEAYRKENPGSELQTAVITPPSKLKPGSKAAKRRKKFCARMGGMPGPMTDEKGRPTRKRLALRRWNCRIR